MTERYGYGYGEEVPASDVSVPRRGSVTEHHDHDHDEDDHDEDDDVQEIDLTDDDAERDRDLADRPVDDAGRQREAAGADRDAEATTQFTPIERDAAGAGAVPASSYLDTRPDPSEADAQRYEPDERDDLGSHDLGSNDPGSRDLTAEETPVAAYGDHGDRAHADRPADDAGDQREAAADESRMDLDDLRGEPVYLGGDDQGVARDDAGRDDQVELAEPTPTPDPGSLPTTGPTSGTSAWAAGDEPAAPAGPDEPLTPATGAATVPQPTSTSAALLESVDAEVIRRQFLDIQAGFVDEPRQAVQQAGELVDDLVHKVLESLTAEREQLVTGVGADTASTEDLRLTLRAYRVYVDRLLGLTM